MKSIRNVGRLPAGQPLVADDIMEFHAARLLLLISVAGTANRIDGLTKLAKLDFFARYPELFHRACQEGAIDLPAPTLDIYGAVEAPMIRFHYGPWDNRYYQVLPYLEGLGLLRISKEANAYRFSLTDKGKDVAIRLTHQPDFVGLVRHMGVIKRALGGKSGNVLKNLIYRALDREVAQRRLGEVIPGAE